MFSNGGHSGHFSLPGAVRRHQLTGVNLKRILSAALCTGLLLGGGAAVAVPAQAAPVVQVAAAKTIAKTALTAQPKSVTAVKGSTVKLKVKARGEALKYQWYKKAPGASKWSKTGTNSSTLTVKKAGTNKVRYRVAITGRSGKVLSKSATVTVRSAYKPSITKLSVSKAASHKATKVTITGSRFNDVTRVYVAGKSVKFKKVSPTRIDVTAPARKAGPSLREADTEDLKKTGDLKTSITVKSATGKSSKSFQYVDYFTEQELAEALEIFKEVQQETGTPTGAMRGIYDSAMAKLKVSGIRQSVASDQLIIAAGALVHPWSLREADRCASEYAKSKALYEDAVKRGDTAAADRHKSDMEWADVERAWYLEMAELILKDMRAAGAKV